MHKSIRRARRGLAIASAVSALVLASTLAAVPASALGSATHTCALGSTTFTGTSTQSQASTYKTGSSCGALATRVRYRVYSSGSLIWSAASIGSGVVVAPVPGYSGGNRGEAGSHQVGWADPGQTLIFTT